MSSQVPLALLGIMSERIIVHSVGPKRDLFCMARLRVYEGGHKFVLAVRCVVNR